MSETKKQKDINLTIEVDAQNVPVRIEWQSSDNPKQQAEECKAMLLSLFDKENLETLKIDLWTKDMQVQEMDRFVFQSLRGIADTYFKATQNRELAVQMQQFVQYFGEKTGILKQ